MSNLEELRQQEAHEREMYNGQLEEMKKKKGEKQAAVEEEWAKAIGFKKSVAAAAINSRSGRPIPAKVFVICDLSRVCSALAWRDGSSDRL